MHMLVKIARFLVPLIVIAGATGRAGAAELCQPSTPGYFHKYLSGKIDERLAFKMELVCKKGALRGSYQYTSKNVPIPLKGTTAPSAKMVIEETAGDGMTSTGRFIGTMQDGHFNGMWTSADGKKKWPFAAEQTAEIHLGTRREIVSATVGDYALVSIVGNGGANAMWDTLKTKKGWGSNVSSISVGMREGSVIKLTSADKRLLDSLTVRVRPDLTTELLARGSVILEIPYNDSGAQFNIKSTTNAYAMDSIKKQWTEAKIEDEKVYLLADNGIDLSRAISGNFDGVTGDVTLVSYSIASDSFDVEFMSGQCCNNSVFTFKRPPKARQAR